MYDAENMIEIFRSSKNWVEFHKTLLFETAPTYSILAIEAVTTRYLRSWELDQYMGRSALALLDRCDLKDVFEIASPAEFADYELLDDSTDPLFLMCEEPSEIDTMVFDSVELGSDPCVTITTGPRFNSDEITVFTVGMTSKPDAAYRKSRANRCQPGGED